MWRGNVIDFYTKQGTEGEGPENVCVFFYMLLNQDKKFQDYGGFISI